MKYIVERDEHGDSFVRISKAKARQVYKNSIVYACPCKMRPFGMMGAGLFIHPDTEDFDSFVNAVEFYNCNYETGRYAVFYMKEN